MHFMKEITKARQQILNNFLENLSGIANKDYQKRIWINAIGPECDDFEESFSDFFELGEYIFDNYKGYGLTDNQYHLLVSLRDELKAFSSKNIWPEKFIDTPEWNKITEMAKDVLTAFIPNVIQKSDLG